jgi:hypothetical protein
MIMSNIKVFKYLLLYIYYKMDPIKSINIIYESIDIGQSLIVYGDQDPYELYEALLENEYPVCLNIKNYDESKYRMYFCHINDFFQLDLQPFNVIFCLDDDCYDDVFNSTDSAEKVSIYKI